MLCPFAFLRNGGGQNSYSTSKMSFDGHWGHWFSLRTCLLVINFELMDLEL